MSNLQLTYIRSGASAVITALAVLYSYYPSEIWITAIISAAATLGIHAIPAIQQGVTQLVPQMLPTPVKVAPVTGGSTMSETPEVAPEVAPQHNPPTQIDGATLMGVRAPVTDPPPVEAAPPVVAPATPTEPVEAFPDPPMAIPPVTATQLRDLADFLENL